MASNRTAKEGFLLVLKGMAMGAADVVPGVSGGTIAFITGIYEELINSIKSINFVTVKMLLTGKFASFWKAINGSFLLTLVSGIAVSIFSLAKLMGYLLTNYPILIWSFFLGLVLASAVYVARTIKTWDWVIWVAFIAGVVVAYLITIITPAEANTTLLFIFVSGAIAICAMILPGISGSFILVLLGMYRFVLDAIVDLNIVVLLIFLAGAAIGIISFSNLLSWLLKNYHNITVAVLVGFMVGSLNKVWPWKKITETFIDRHGEVKPLAETNILPGTYEHITGNSPMLGGAILLAITGFILIFVIEGLTTKRQ